MAMKNVVFAALLGVAVFFWACLFGSMIGSREYLQYFCFTLIFAAGVYIGRDSK